MHRDRIIISLELNFLACITQTFNQFFIRELKPGVRPIAYENNGAVAVSAADCRLMAFNSADDATRFWIKVRFITSGVTSSLLLLRGWL